MKKSFCRAVSMTIAVLFIFSLVSFAAENEKPVLQTSQVSFLDAGGNMLSQLAANSQITARLAAKGTAGRSVKASLILAYYEYGFLKSLKSCDTTVSAGKETLMEASVTTGSKPEKGKLKAFLWESYEGSTILSKSAEFGSKDASVSGLLLDGVPLEGFSPEITSYQIALPASSLDYPEIHAVTGDLAAEVQLTKGTFPSDVEVKVVSSDKSAQKLYRIAFSKQEAAVSNVTLHYTSGQKDITASAVIQNAANPEFITPPNGATEGLEYFGMDNLKSYTKCVCDRNTYLINLPDYLLGSTVIAGSQSETANADQKTQIKDKTNKKLMTFDLNASADIYYMIVTKGTESSLLNYAPWLTEYRFRYVENLPNWVEGATQAKIRDGSVFKKTVTVEEGATQTVTLGGNEMLFTTPIVFVVWKTGDDVAQLKEITVDGMPLDGFSPDVTEYEYTLSSASQGMPEIGASPVTENAQVVISRDEANKKITIQVTSANGKQTAEYTIQFHEFQPSVSDITLYGAGGVSKDITKDALIKDIQEPTFKAGSSSDNGYYEFANVGSCSKMIYDRNTYLINIPQEWIGGTVIAGGQTDAKSGVYQEPIKNGTNSKVLSFTIDNSAHVYYIYPGKQSSFANVKWAEAEGYELTNITSGWVEGGNAGAQPIEGRMTVFQKTIEVEQGSTKTVNIGGATGTFTSPIVVLQWFYPEKEAELKEIRINGVPFEDFHTDTLSYTQPFPEGAEGMPEVMAEATLEDAAVQVTTEKMTAIITVTSADGTVSKTYRITFAVTPVVSNVQMHFGDQTKAVTAIDTNIQEPVFYDATLTGTELYKYTNLKSKTHLIGDRETYLMDIPENLLGQTILSGSQTDAKTYASYVKDGSNGNLMTFDVNCSANIYYFLYATSPSYTNIAWAETAGFIPTDLSIKWVEGKGAEPIAPKTNLVVYKKTVEVPQGQTATVSIGGQTGTFTCPSVVIEWIQ